MPSVASPLIANGSNAAIITFAIYIVGVMLLAALSNRLMQSKSFLSEYFLGSRSLGVWAFALTFAATSASGGSFIGFPSLVYTHGWIVALWIGSYMIVPIVSMGLLAKRINQVGRKTGAITIPDVLRDRFESVAFGSLATGLIIFFMAFNLIAQFKGGSVILQTLLSDVPLFESAKDAVGAFIKDVPLLSSSAADPGYFICLLVFAVAVIIYTTYGGFRAVVWTDVMQGFVMVGGVVIMLPLTLAAVGGLDNATQEMAKMTTPVNVELKLEASAPVQEMLVVPKSQWLVLTESETTRYFRTKERSEIAPDEAIAHRSEAPDDPAKLQAIPAIEVALTEGQHAAVKEDLAAALPLDITVLQSKPYAAGADVSGAYVTGPGPSADAAGGFLPLSLAVSFFFMWTFSGAGQPSNMVRLMAFKQSNTLRRAIFTVSIYYSLIYFPLVIIFCCARVLLPGWETESDRIMPEMAKLVTLAIDMPWLAGLLVAAPFAAVMSTMDSFLLMISSALVRDVYQRNINPRASDKTVKRLTYITTLAVGIAAMLVAMNPPAYLQDIIVFTGSGLSTSFLAPVALSLYWPRFNKQGAISGMLGGFFTHISLYAAGYAMTGKMMAFQPFDFHPFMVGLFVSTMIAIVVASITPPPPTRLVQKFFCREAS